MAEIIRLLGRYLDQSYPEKQELLQFPKAVLSLPLGTANVSTGVQAGSVGGVSLLGSFGSFLIPSPTA